MARSSRGERAARRRLRTRTRTLTLTRLRTGPNPNPNPKSNQAAHWVSSSSIASDGGHCCCSR